MKMRRVDKEIDKLIAQMDLCKAGKMASAVGYYVHVWDGDGETGPMVPEMEVSRKQPDCE